MNAYQQLEDIFERVYYLESAIAMLHWDAAVMMPSKSYEARGHQIATIETQIHALLTNPETSDLLSEAEQSQMQLDEWQAANLYEMRRSWHHNNAVPANLVKAMTLAGSECEMVWRKARADNDFAAYAPKLENVIQLTREIAAAKGEALQCSPYDALIDQFDPGLTMETIDRIFGQLKEFIPELIEQTTRHSLSPIEIISDDQYSVEQQKKLGSWCLQQVGFDLDYGRFDVSHHPFCGGVPGDVRITTRYDTSDFTSALMGVMHESGHALYEQQLPKQWITQPVGKARGMALHESQSLLVEMQLCRSPEFLSFLLPTIKTIFGVEGKAWSLDNFTALYHRVERGLIRVDADEVTYPAHIMLRYELEKTLINGSLKVKDLPEAWAAGMQHYVGITPDNDQNGCMQDIHWTDGSFGYFPSYTLGAIIAAQLFATMKRDMPSMMDDIACGNFIPLQQWLRNHLHGLASKLSTNALIQSATGDELSVEAYKQHLYQRYMQ